MIGALRFLLVILGASAIAIFLSVFFAGPAQTASFSEQAYDAVTGARARLTGPWPPTMDSELRFYAPFWGAYGIVLLAISRDLAGYRRLVVPLMALFFIGGAGRALSWAMVGAPHPFFLLLMAIELVLPVIIIGLWFEVRHRV